MRIKYIPTADIRNVKFNSFIEKHFPEFIHELKPELILVTGGDGALLHAIQQYNHLQIPFFGHAGGTLNFLMNDLGNIKSTLTQIKSDKRTLHTMETASIKVGFIRNGKYKHIGYSVNEVVLGSEIMGYHHFCITSDDSAFENFEVKGTGLCVSADLGSTGYNFNLGGSILPIGSGLWSIMGIACNRYLNDILKVGLMKVATLSDRHPISLYLDGINRVKKVRSGDCIQLEKGQTIRIVFLNHDSFVKKRIEITSRLRKG